MWRVSCGEVVGEGRGVGRGSSSGKVYGSQGCRRVLLGDGSGLARGRCKGLGRDWRARSTHFKLLSLVHCLILELQCLILELQ
jgi:hypothetical protein